MRNFLLAVLLFSGCAPVAENYPDASVQHSQDASLGDNLVLDSDVDLDVDLDAGPATNSDATRNADATWDAHMSQDGGHATDSAVPDTGSSDTATPDTATPDTAVPDTATHDDAGTQVPTPTPTPVVLTTTYFGANATTERGTSAWATASYPDALPVNKRSSIFWGRFQQNACASPGYGLAEEHPLSINGAQNFHAFYPDCAGAFGPSVEADIYAHGAPQHLLRSEIRPTGAFQSFGASGQNTSGANAYIQAIYTQFNPAWASSVSNRMRPWAGPSQDPALARFALRVKESVSRDLLEAPNSQQLQQVLRMLVINEDCNPAESSSFCQIEFNFKTYNRGVGAYTSFTSGDVFNDAGQGGLIAVVGPIAATGQSTQIHGASAWTSWGSATQLAAFQDQTFQVEMNWNQFQQLLLNVTNDNPVPVFGASWQNRQSWILLRIGYGQENYNPSTSASSLVEGMFESLEIFAL